jgi:hypothetical protein
MKDRLLCHTAQPSEEAEVVGHVLEDVEAQGDIKRDVSVGWSGLHEADAPASFRRDVPQRIRRNLETY